MKAMKLLAGLGVLVIGACSVLNREGPEVTCDQLGPSNACEEGIIASCDDGIVKYEACDDKDACKESWQQAGRWRCKETDPFPCPSGQASCSNVCIDVRSDAYNCGKCGNYCNGMPCVNGECACPAGLAPCNGGCVDTQNDVTNCGGCGVGCSFNQFCSGGFCQ